MRKLFAIVLGLALLASPAMAVVTYDITPNYTKAVAPTTLPGTPGVPSLLSRTIDCAKGVTGSVNGQTTATLINDRLTSNSDVFIIQRIPAKTVVYGVSVSITTAEGSALTFKVGDSGSTTRYISSVNGNSAAASNSMATYATLTSPTASVLTQPIGMGKYYATADYITLNTFSVVPKRAVIRVRITAAQFN